MLQAVMHGTLLKDLLMYSSQRLMLEPTRTPLLWLRRLRSIRLLPEAVQQDPEDQGIQAPQGPVLPVVQEADPQ